MRWCQLCTRNIHPNNICSIFWFDNNSNPCRGVLDTTLFDNIYQWLGASKKKFWESRVPPPITLSNLLILRVIAESYSRNASWYLRLCYRYARTEVLLRVALSPQTQKPNQGLLIDMLCLPCNVYRLLDKGKCFNMSVVFANVNVRGVELMVWTQRPSISTYILTSRPLCPRP